MDIDFFLFPDNPGGNQALDLNNEKELTYKSGDQGQGGFSGES